MSQLKVTIIIDDLSKSENDQFPNKLNLEVLFQLNKFIANESL